MICPQCGTELPDGAVFCSSCGNAITSQPVAEPQQPQQPQQPVYQDPYAQPQQPEQPVYQDSYAQPQQPPVAQQVVAAPVQDKGSIGWAILGFLIPLVGIILFLVWRNKKPNSAKMSIIGAAIGFAFNLVVQLLTQ